MSISGLNFFASANSGKGFVNFYGDIFKDLKKHYIIKGGPGTGKSSLMKAVAKEAESKGMTVERFYCSSDPDSLDGIIIKDLSVGITDGTAPHTADPVYPGVLDEIIDLGAFWDKGMLEEAKDHITDTVKQKSRLYKDVYSYLNAALTLDNVKQRRLQDSLDLKGIYDLSRFYANAIPYCYGKESVRLTEGITMKGPYRFTPFGKEAEIVYNIKDSFGIGHIFLNHIRSLLAGNEMTVSYEALDPQRVNTLYLPKYRILFCINEDSGEEINTDIFVTSNIKDNIGSEIQKLTADAYHLLTKIESLHFSLEEIYIKAMDFTRKEEYQYKLIKKIFT